MLSVWIGHDSAGSSKRAAGLISLPGESVASAEFDACRARAHAKAGQLMIEVAGIPHQRGNRKTDGLLLSAVFEGCSGSNERHSGIVAIAAKTKGTRATRAEDVRTDDPQPFQRVPTSQDSAADVEK
jgi:hypothetical protein